MHRARCGLLFNATSWCASCPNFLSEWMHTLSSVLVSAKPLSWMFSIIWNILTRKSGKKNISWKIASLKKEQKELKSINYWNFLFDFYAYFIFLGNRHITEELNMADCLFDDDVSRVLFFQFVHFKSLNYDLITVSINVYSIYFICLHSDLLFSMF